MNAIIGLTTLAADHADDPREVREDLNKVAISSRVLLSIINDILDMSAIESGKLKIAHAPFDFKQLISSLTLSLIHISCSNGRTREISRWR